MYAEVKVTAVSRYVASGSIIRSRYNVVIITNHLPLSSSQAVFIYSKCDRMCGSRIGLY